MGVQTREEPGFVRHDVKATGPLIGGVWTSVCRWDQHRSVRTQEKVSSTNIPFRLVSQMVLHQLVSSWAFTTLPAKGLENGTATSTALLRKCIEVIQTQNGDVTSKLTKYGYFENLLGLGFLFMKPTQAQRAVNRVRWRTFANGLRNMQDWSCEQAQTSKHPEPIGPTVHLSVLPAVITCRGLFSRLLLVRLLLLIIRTGVAIHIVI